MYKDKKIIAIIQARMESKRLPGKVLMDLAGKPVLEWMINRISKSVYVDKIVIAIPNSNPSKDIINMWRDRGWNTKCSICSGSMNNVIKRVINTGYIVKIDRSVPNIIVDITADCPLIDPRYIDLFIENLINKDLDYYSNVVERTWPDGCDIQVYKLETLSRVYLKIKNKTHKKHVGWNIIQFPNDYKIENYPAPPIYNYPKMRLTLDTRKDYKLLNKIFNEFKNFGCFHIEDVIKFINVNPHLQKINNKVIAKIPGEG